QIMLYRVLDCYNLMQNNPLFDHPELMALLREKASRMLGWLEAMRYRDGSIPHLNDSTDGIAPTSSALKAYAQRLGITTEKIVLKESGYRKFVTDRYEMVADVGNIGPDYIPGHAHSDTFNFELHIDDRPFIVDTGISTYENNERRKLERATGAHNTVRIDRLDQSEVWSSFRVARRAKIVALEASEKMVRATHDGYKRIGVLHTRQFEASETTIKIKDIIASKRGTSHEAVAFLHFAPGVKPEMQGNNKIRTNAALLTFMGLKSLKIVDIHIAEGYNRLVASKGLVLGFEKELETQIEVRK
ncbi:MAG TPA: prenyltransferase, partial [Sulfuricurvum sp.]|nr:prenyltransferase [Sulfuricurvum sp.]